jgi:protein-S-isoprenylcysteine O-methyltransferase Ste14
LTLASLLQDYWPSLLAFGLFGLLHSVGAREPFKQALARWTSPFFVEHFWRILYCALSFVALYSGVASLHWARHVENDVWLIVYPDWLWQVITVLHLGSIALLYVAFFQSDYLEFLGVTQAWRGILALCGRPASPTTLELFGTHRLVVTGLYAWVRHPMMMAGLLFLLTSGPSLNNLIYTAMYTAYMVIGGYYEERRLIRIFGEDYVHYRARVGAFYPRLRRRLAA